MVRLLCPVSHRPSGEVTHEKYYTSSYRESLEGTGGFVQWIFNDRKSRGLHDVKVEGDGTAADGIVYVGS